MKPLDYFFDHSASGADRYPQRFCTFFCTLVRILFGLLFRFKAFDSKRIRRDQAYIVAGNHRSYLDPVFVMMALRPRPIRYMAKEEFFKVGVIARMAAWVGAFPVKRDAADMKVIKRSVTMLKRGELLGIFPEGTRGRDLAVPREQHQGVAVIAQLAKAKVVPMRIWGTEYISPPDSKRWHFPRVTIRFGEPISLDDPIYDGLDKDARFAAFTADVMTAVYALENPRDVHDNSPVPHDSQPAPHDNPSVPHDGQPAPHDSQPVSQVNQDISQSAQTNMDV